MEEQMLDKIEAYLNGNMTAQEEKEFDAAIENDPELAAAVDQFGLANDAIEILIEDNLREELKSLQQEEATADKVVSINRPQQQTKRRSLRVYLAAAASVAVLLGFFGVNWAGNNYSNEAIKEDVYASYSMPNIRSGNNQAHPFEEGLTAFESKDYNTAIQFFQGIPATDERFNEAQFYLGHALLENGSYQQASSQFKKVVDLKDIRYTESAEWYQLLALLSDGQLGGDFQSLLSKIAADKDHTFNTKAVQLQTKLGSFWRKLVF
jgi:TolA-binding protein